VNPGGEPERDDFGLPPVDIEIPDDARELDRDVQAYHRELRAQRRHLRRHRLRGPLASDGMVMPLLAGCLVFALIAAVLLTVFAATGDVVPRSILPHGASGRNAPGAAAPGSTSAAGAIFEARSPLPDKTIEVSGKNVALRTLTTSALALVPAGCGCQAALQQMIKQALESDVALYLVTTDPGVAALQRIASPHPAVRVADDHQNVLATAYSASGLSVILVGADGSVSLAQRLQPGLQLETEFLDLRQSGTPAVSPST
jgi:hypothetical protein